MKMIKVKRLTESAILPTRAKEGDICYDLYADQSILVYENCPTVVKTGIALEAPEGYGFQIHGRSGLTSKTPLRVNTGNVDNGYRGEIGILVDCIDGKFQIEKGDRIAQLELIKIPDSEIVEVDELSDASRGADGFGSTGVGEQL